MTCIVGVATRNGVWIGADSETTNGWSKFQNATSKIYRLGEMLLAHSGPVRVSNILRYQFTPPDDAGEDPLRYLVAHFVSALRAVLREQGVLKVSDAQEGLDDSMIMVGYRGGLFEINSDFSVVSHQRGYNAIGVGYQYVLGALSVTEALPEPERVLLALSVAAKHSLSVSEPFVVECLEAAKDG